ncbi:MAG TPA: ChbG/HpnK family deacetylase [Xanthobacteraceae bacterium]
MSPRRIVLCADDYGLAPGVNAAIRDLLVRGRINATSVMVHPPSFDREAAQGLAEAAAVHGAGIGLHVTLTAPFRPLVPGFAPLREGAFRPVGATLAAAMLRRFEPNALRAEIEAQFDLFENAFGRAPDHVDGHQHVHLFPQVRDAVLAAVQAHAPRAWVRQCGAVRLDAMQLRNPKALLIGVLSRTFRSRAAALGIATNPAFSGSYVFSPAADFPRLFPGFLDGLPERAVVMCHPGTVDPELERLDPLTTSREQEYAYFTGKQFPAALATANVTVL